MEISELVGLEVINAILKQKGMRLEKIPGKRTHVLHSRGVDSIPFSSKRAAVKVVNRLIGNQIKSADEFYHIIEEMNDSAEDTIKQMVSRIRDLEAMNELLISFTDNSEKFAKRVLKAKLDNPVIAKDIKSKAASCLAKHKQLLGE